MRISEFLEQYRPGGPWWLVCIRDGGLRGETFSDAERAEKWALGKNADKWNIYYHINPHHEGSHTGKALKKDIAQVEWLYADIDPDPTKEFNGERARLLQLAEKSKKTLAVDSGNGIQLLWRLNEARPIGTDVENDILTIGQHLGGDSVQNTDRVFRLPGTVNWPNEKKRALGRESVESKVLYFNDTTWDTVDVLLWARSASQHAGSSQSSAQGEKSDETETEFILPADIRDKIKTLSDKIREGGVDRSRVLWHACNVLLRAGLNEDEALRVITDKQWNFTDHLETRGDSRAYAKRHTSRVWDEAADPRIAGLNRKHFYADLGTHPFIWEIQDDGSAIPKRPAAFILRYGNIKVEMPAGEKVKIVGLGQYWLEHPRRRSYPKGVRFRPGIEQTEGEYNLWQPRNIQPVEGDLHKPWLEHIHANLCGGNDEYFKHMLQWVALPMQKPGYKLGTTIVMRGPEGAGKGSFVLPLGKLYGKHYQHIHGIEGIIGRFNHHLEDKLFVYADEAIWGGLKGSVGIINALITENVINVERKHTDLVSAPNHINFVFASNADWVVPASGSARRYFVLDVEGADGREAWLRENIVLPLEENEELFLGNLLHELIHYDCSDFFPFFAPKTEALKRQQREGWDIYTLYAYAILDRGYTGADGRWSTTVYASDMWDEFLGFSRGGNISRPYFTSKIRPLLGARRRGETLILPMLSVAREHFEKKAGGVVRWTAPPSDEDSIHESIHL